MYFQNLERLSANAGIDELSDCFETNFFNN